MLLSLVVFGLVPGTGDWQEFKRLCALHGLSVTAVPIEQHHPFYCSDEIEIWEVARCGLGHGHTRQQDVAAGGSGVSRSSCSDKLQVLSWTATEVCLSSGRSSGSDSGGTGAGGGEEVIRIEQSADAIGCSLWASSIIVSRYVPSRLYYFRICTVCMFILYTQETPPQPQLHSE